MSIIPPCLIKAIRRNTSRIYRDSLQIKDPFEESNRLIDNAKKSYFEMMEEKERTIRESANPSEPNL